MRHEGNHLSDRDLILSTDGELPVRRQQEVREHLDACRLCRERMISLDTVFAEIVRSRNQEFDVLIPPVTGPRALLRARMAGRAVPGEPASIWTVGRSAIRRISPFAGAVFAATILMVLTFEATVNADGPRPKASLTPGETRPITTKEVCRTDAEVVSRDIPEDTRRTVLAAYGINGSADRFEVDYLITPDLGGTRSIRNLWPQPYSARWNAHVKDELEQRLHQLVCEGKVDLPTAQHDIATDWIGAYKKYFRATSPAAGH